MHIHPNILGVIHEGAPCCSVEGEPRHFNEGFIAMKSWLRWILIVTGTVLVALALLRQHYVLSSVKLDEAIKAEVPVGSPKARVVNFIQIRHPVAYDDMGIQVKARLQGLAENMIYRKDIVITFEFSPDGKLLSYSAKEYLTFL
jgi:hypothetical protein